MSWIAVWWNSHGPVNTGKSRIYKHIFGYMVVNTGKSGIYKTIFKDIEFNIGKIQVKIEYRNI